jgi:hypothetical protein
VPVLGGEPQVLLPNAAGLTWINSDHVLFSEVRTGMHMGIVTSRPNRAERRDIYFPPHERAMAHYSSLSPDGRSVLVSEMTDIGSWVPCRRVPFDGSTSGVQVGPSGACTGAGWSPDGRWMYFSVEIEGHRHLWRQRFPDGAPEQLTFGPDDHDGVAVFPDGSLATSIGISQSAIWIKDHEAERAITTSGSAAPGGTQGMSSRPVFSREGRYLYYLLRREAFETSTELWRYEMSSGRREPVVTGFPVTDYDIDPEGQQVVFAAQQAGHVSELWLASLDRSGPPRRIAASGEVSPYFGSRGEVIFRMSAGGANYIGRLAAPGAIPTRISPEPISTLLAISPDRKWAVVFAPLGRAPDAPTVTLGVPLDGGTPVRVCDSFCLPRWSPDGRQLYLPLNPPSRTEPPRSVAIPLAEGEVFPPRRDGDSPLSRWPGARLVEGGSDSADYRMSGFSPSSDPDVFAFVKSSVHHNIYRID